MHRELKLSTILLIVFIAVSLSACSASGTPSAGEAAGAATVTESASAGTDIQASAVEQSYGSAGAKSDVELTLDEMLIYAIQDEYLAHAEYDAVITEFGSQTPFSNIIKAEETHIGLLKPLFDKYDVVLPDDTAKDHVIAPESIKNALELGIGAEVSNIAMYELFLNQEIPDDIKSTFEELKKASESHLSAFRNKYDKL